MKALADFQFWLYAALGLIAAVITFLFAIVGYVVVDMLRFMVKVSGLGVRGVIRELWRR